MWKVKLYEIKNGVIVEVFDAAGSAKRDHITYYPKWPEALKAIEAWLKEGF